MLLGQFMNSLLPHHTELDLMKDSVGRGILKPHIIYPNLNK